MRQNRTLRKQLLADPRVQDINERIITHAMIPNAAQSTGGMINSIDATAENDDTLLFLRGALDGSIITPDDSEGVVGGAELARRLELTIGKKVAYTVTEIEPVSVLGSSVHADTDFALFTPADAAFLAHTCTLWRDIDWTLLAGKLAGKWIVGGGVQAEVGPVSLYTEGHVGFPDEDGDFTLDDQNRGEQPHVKVTGGFSLMFDWRNAATGSEYAYFSNGNAPNQYLVALLLRPYPDELPYLGKQYGSVSYGMDLHPLVRINAMLLMNLLDLSGLGSLSCGINIGDNAEVIVGTLIPFGKKMTHGTDGAMITKSEFGTAPLTAFTELRYYY